MPILPLIGHHTLRERFVKAAQRGALPPSLLLHGEARVGKQRLGLWLGQLLLCETPSEGPCARCRSCRFVAELTHPDLHWFFPRPRDTAATAAEALEDMAMAVRERVEAHGIYPPHSGADGIRIAYVHALVSKAALSPAIARRKVFVIGEAQQMVQGGTEVAANAFLKLLEEPPADTTFILTSSEPGALLPTILSRVARIRVARLSDADVREFLALDPVRAELNTPEDAEARVRLAAGAPGRLFGADPRDAALTAATRLLDGIDGSRAAQMRAAWVQGAAQARGAFTDTLEELVRLLHGRVRAAVDHADVHAAARYATAIGVAEEARERAQDNVNPQLLAAALLREAGRNARR